METELELLKLRVQILEKETEQIRTDVHKIVNQLAAMKYTLIGVIVAESPQAVEAIMKLLGLN